LSLDFEVGLCKGKRDNSRPKTEIATAATVAINGTFSGLVLEFGILRVFLKCPEVKLEMFGEFFVSKWAQTH
jgi:hypothetical protein